MVPRYIVNNAFLPPPPPRPIEERIGRRSAAVCISPRIKCSRGQKGSAMKSPMCWISLPLVLSLSIPPPPFPPPLSFRPSHALLIFDRLLRPVPPYTYRLVLSSLSLSLVWPLAVSPCTSLLRWYVMFIFVSSALPLSKLLWIGSLFQRSRESINIVFSFSFLLMLLLGERERGARARSGIGCH